MSASEQGQADNVDAGAIESTSVSGERRRHNNWHADNLAPVRSLGVRAASMHRITSGRPRFMSRRSSRAKAEHLGEVSTTAAPTTNPVQTTSTAFPSQQNLDTASTSSPRTPSVGESATALSNRRSKFKRATTLLAALRAAPASPRPPTAVTEIASTVVRFGANDSGDVVEEQCWSSSPRVADTSAPSVASDAAVSALLALPLFADVQSGVLEQLVAAATIVPLSAHEALAPKVRTGPMRRVCFPDLVWGKALVSLR